MNLYKKGRRGFLYRWEVKLYLVGAPVRGSGIKLGVTGILKQSDQIQMR